MAVVWWESGKLPIEAQAVFTIADHPQAVVHRLSNGEQFAIHLHQIWQGQTAFSPFFGHSSMMRGDIFNPQRRLHADPRQLDDVSIRSSDGNPSALIASPSDLAMASRRDRMVSMASAYSLFDRWPAAATLRADDPFQSSHGSIYTDYKQQPDTGNIQIQISRAALLYVNMKEAKNQWAIAPRSAPAVAQPDSAKWPTTPFRAATQLPLTVVFSHKSMLLKN
ncbi:hypothetical protein ACLOJK_040520 [Asimina triloba]